MNMDVILTGKCEICSAPVPIHYHRGPGGIVLPRPETIQFSVTDWSEEKKDLFEVQMEPDINCLLLCESCRVEFIASVVASYRMLQERKGSRTESKPIPKRVLM